MVKLLFTRGNIMMIRLLTLLEGGGGRFLAAGRHEALLRSATLAHRHQAHQTLTSPPRLSSSALVLLHNSCPLLLLL